MEVGKEGDWRDGRNRLDFKWGYFPVCLERSAPWHAGDVANSRIASPEGDRILQFRAAPRLKVTGYCNFA